MRIFLTFNNILVESLVGILVVFIALTLLVVAFIIMGRISKYLAKRKHLKSGLQQLTITELNVYDAAAISYALHLYLNELHDEESGIITIKKVERRYSPWNSKIYAVNAFKQ